MREERRKREREGGGSALCDRQTQGGGKGGREM